MNDNDLAGTRALVDLGAIASLSGFTLRQMRGKLRDRDVTDARHLAFWWLRTHHGLSYSVIGRMMHHDHSTVMAAVKGFEARCRRSPRLARWREVAGRWAGRDWLLLGAA